MGFKRPFDEEEFQELPFKHLRQLEYINKTQFDEVVPLSSIPQKPASGVENEGNLCKSQSGESSDDETFGEESNFVDPGLDTGATCAWVTNGLGEEYNTTHSSSSQRHFDFDVPPRVLAPAEGMYTLLLDHPPIKQVLLGPNHQADIPEWEGNNKDENTEPADGQKLMGTCVILAMVDGEVGEGRKPCNCPDKGSVRCVRQHIKEAREELIETFGYEKFEKLGFGEMGEEVARKWSEGDEQHFHEVVYSNPVSLGLNFWMYMEAAFPSRTKAELVSYYFNVFILRRRATQNRTLMLDIDSDDDEWHGDHGSSLDMVSSAAERVYPICDEDGESDSGNEAEVDPGHGMVLSDDYRMKPKVVEVVDKYSENVGDGLNVEDDSCTSFDHHVHRDAVSKQLIGCNDAVSHVYLFDMCDDNKVWDAKLRNSGKKSKELQPPPSIIEEIYGHRKE